MKTVILTGGIGTGKTTVTELLEDRGAYVIRADEVSKNILNKGEPAYEEVLEAFGEKIVDENTGEINRSELAKIVFNDKLLLEKLNSITHKRVYEKIKREINVIKGIPLIVVEIPLLDKKGFSEIGDEVWAVTCDEEVRIKRLCDLRGFSETDARARIAAQPSKEEYFAIADETIDNGEDMEHVARQLDNLLRRKKML